MGDFLYSVMSDILLDLRKNRRKVLVFCAILVVALIMSIMVVNKGAIMPYYKTGVFTGLASGLRSSFGYFYMVVLLNAFSLLGLGACTCPEKVLFCWPIALFFRMTSKFCDIICALQFMFFSCAIAAVLCMVFEILTAAAYFIVYIDLCERKINLFCYCDRTLLSPVIYPVCVVIMILSVIQSIVAGLLIF